MGCGRYSASFCNEDRIFEYKVNLASGPIARLLDLLLVPVEDDNSLGQRLVQLKEILEPKKSKFGFRLATSSSSVDIDDADQLREVCFTKLVRKQIEKLLVFYHGEVANTVAMADEKFGSGMGRYCNSLIHFTRKELLVMRQTMRLAGISVTYFSSAEQ